MVTQGSIEERAFSQREFGTSIIIFSYTRIGLSVPASVDSNAVELTRKISGSIKGIRTRDTCIIEQLLYHLIHQVPIPTYSLRYPFNRTV